MHEKNGRGQAPIPSNKKNQGQGFVLKRKIKITKMRNINNLIITNSVNRINEKINPHVLAFTKDGKRKVISIDNGFKETMMENKDVITFLNGFEYALDHILKK